MRPGDAFSERQADAVPPIAAGPIRPIEPLKNMRQVGCADTDSEVFDRNRDLRIAALDTDYHIPASARILQRVIEQHEEQPAQRRAIAGNHSGPIAQLRPQAYLSLLSEAMNPGEYIAQHVTDIDRLERHLHRPRVVARQDEEVLHKLSHSFGFGGNLLKRIAIGFRRAGPAESQLRGRPDHGQWRAELVGGVRDQS